MAYIFKHYSKTTPTGTGIVFTAYKLPSYSITYNLTNLTSDATNPATIGIGETASIRITAPTGYNLPSRITVTGCEYTWEANTGVLNISNPTGNVTITAEGVAETYSVTVNLTGVTGESTNPTTVSYGGSATFKFTANENYELPADVEQTGATSYNWNKATGTLVLTNITGPVTVTITGVATTPQLATPQNVTAAGTTVSWDEVENATSYAVLADGSEIGTVNAIKQLATPQNVTANETTVSWDAVENATSYEVLVNNSSFGTVSTTSVDLSTLAGWEDLNYNLHAVTIIAKAAGYNDSEPSEPAFVVKRASFVQIFPTTTPDNYTLFDNLNQSKVYTVLIPNNVVQYPRTLTYSNGRWEAKDMIIISQTSNSVKAVVDGKIGYFINYENGITLEGPYEADFSYLDKFSTTQVYAQWRCLVEGTKIILSDGSTKPVQDIQYGDKVLCYDFTNGVQTTSYIDWMIPESVATKYWEITLSDGTVLNLVGSNGKSHRLYNVTKQRFDYPQDFELNDLTIKEDGTTVSIVSCKQIEKTVKFYNIASHEHINVYANGVLTSNRLNNRFKIVNNKFTAEKVMTDEEVASYRNYLDAIKAK